MEPYLGEIRLFSFARIPVGWLPCDGRLMQVTQNAALFSLLSNYYGGDGKVTFALPDLRGRVAVHRDPRPNPLPCYPVGTKGGLSAATLTINNLPLHTHSFIGTAIAASSTQPVNAFFANTKSNNVPDQYVVNPQSTNIGNPSPMMLGTTGAAAPISNMQPYLVLNYCIAILGDYPPRN